jgi:pimeloyl-ACP methyl ester carboxylesterase
MMDVTCLDSLAINEEAIMVGRLLIQGLLAGLMASLIAFGFARVFGEPQIDRAIAFEQKMDAAKDAAAGVAHDHEEELVSRQTQAGLGLLTGAAVFGTSIGGLFALTFALLYGRVKTVNASRLSIVLAGAAFIALVIVPMLKYPANPPSVGDPATIGARTALYFLFIAFSIATMVVSIRARHAWMVRLGEWNATLAAAALYIALIVAGLMLFPTVNEVPVEFPAQTLWQFRMASIGTQFTMWTSLGVLFGALVEYKGRVRRSGLTRRASA